MCQGILTHEDLTSQQEEDRYKLMLSRSDSENIASNYFRPKRASQILSSDPMKSLSECPAHLVPPPQPGEAWGVFWSWMDLGLKSLSLHEPQFFQQ